MSREFRVLLPSWIQALPEWAKALWHSRCLERVILPRELEGEDPSRFPPPRGALTIRPGYILEKNIYCKTCILSGEVVTPRRYPPQQTSLTRSWVMPTALSSYPGSHSLSPSVSFLSLPPLDPISSMPPCKPPLRSFCSWYPASSIKILARGTTTMACQRHVNMSSHVAIAHVAGSMCGCDVNLTS